MGSFQKLKWIGGLTLAFLLILAMGRTNLRNFEQVQASIEEIYEDRLVVKGLIFDMALLLHRKELANATEDATFYRFVNASVNAQFEEKIQEFRRTKLTAFEAETLGRFEENLELLVATEEDLRLGEGGTWEPEGSQLLDDLVDGLEEDLRALSNIQLAEGRRQMMVSDDAVDTMHWIARVETYLLAFLALAVVAVVLYGSKDEKA